MNDAILINNANICIFFDKLRCQSYFSLKSPKTTKCFYVNSSKTPKCFRKTDKSPE